MESALAQIADSGASRMPRLVPFCAPGTWRSGAQSRPNGESFNRLLVIERANLGAKGSHQLIVHGGGALDKTEVRLVVAAGPFVGRVCGVAGLPYGEQAAPASVYHVAVSHKGKLGERLTLSFRGLEQTERGVSSVSEGLDRVSPDAYGIDQQRVREKAVRVVPRVPPRLADDRGIRVLRPVHRLLERIRRADPASCGSASLIAVTPKK